MPTHELKGGEEGVQEEGLPGEWVNTRKLDKQRMAIK